MTTRDTLDRNLHLPIDGKTYVIAPPDIPTGRYITKVMSVGMQAANGHMPSDKTVGSLKLNDDEEADLYERILGDVADEMVADGVDFNSYALAGQAMMIWVVADKEKAMEFWNSGGNPKAGKTPQDRKRPAKSAPRASTATKSLPAKPKGKKATTSSAS